MPTSVTLNRATIVKMLDAHSLTPFTKQVLLALLDVPRSTTITYGQLARKIGRPEAVRAVARALSRNPLPGLLPCHRVVAKNSPGGFAFGIKLKKQLLDFERHP